MRPTGGAVVSLHEMHFTLRHHREQCEIILLAENRKQAADADACAGLY